MWIFLHGSAKDTHPHRTGSFVREITNTYFFTYTILFLILTGNLKAYNATIVITKARLRSSYLLISSAVTRISFNFPARPKNIYEKKMIKADMSG